MVGATTRRTTKEAHHTVHPHAHTQHATYTYIKTNDHIPRSQDQEGDRCRTRSRKGLQQGERRGGLRRADHRHTANFEVSGALRDLIRYRSLPGEGTDGRDDSDVALENGGRAGPRVSISGFRGNRQDFR